MDIERARRYFLRHPVDRLLDKTNDQTNDQIRGSDDDLE